MDVPLHGAKSWQLWESFYPPTGLDDERRRLLAILEASMPGFVALLVTHRPRTLRGASLLETIGIEERQPACLAAHYRAWRASPIRMRATSPTLACAVIGQARMDGHISPEAESRLLGNLLTYWALGSTLDTSALCAMPPTAQRAALTT